LQADVNDGDLVVAIAAVDRTGYGRLTVPPGFPAVADVHLTHALLAAAAREGGPGRLHSGIVLTNDNFYAGVATLHTPHYSTLSQANVLAVEMECAALFIVGSLRRVETAAILAVDGNVLAEGESMDAYNPQRAVVAAAVAAGIEIALAALLERVGHV
jgi:uridine phosphorylase